MIEYTIKKHLNDIINNLDVDEEIKKKYKWFRIEYSNEVRKNSSGDYDADERKIVIYKNDNNVNANEVCTVLHELAHHCDICNRGKTDHQKTFYEMYAKIVYSALDLDKISKDDMMSMNYNNSDYQKVIKILKAYERKKPIIKYKKYYDSVDLHIYDGFTRKDTLKLMGYHWNQKNKSWYKTVNADMLESEIETIKSLGIKDFDIEDSNKMLLNKEK